MHDEHDMNRIFSSGPYDTLLKRALDKRDACRESRNKMHKPGHEVVNHLLCPDMVLSLEIHQNDAKAKSIFVTSSPLNTMSYSVVTASSIVARRLQEKTEIE